MIIMREPLSDEMQNAIIKDSEELTKEAIDAIETNREEAEEIEKYHGEDTKSVKDVVTDSVDKKQLKAMHLSESLFEDLNSDERTNFKSDIYNAVLRTCYNYKYDGVSSKDLDEALEFVSISYKDDEDFKECFVNETDNVEIEDIPGFEGTWDKLSELNLFSESLNEELSQKGQKVLDELKKELGPELQKKVAFVIKDYAANEKKPEPQKQPENKSEEQSEQQNESLQEDYEQDYEFLKNEEKKIFEALEKYHIYPDDLMVELSPGGGMIVADVHIHMGDWKHEHWACHDIMSELGYRRLKFDEEDNGTDTYDAWHKYVKLREE